MVPFFLPYSSPLVLARLVLPRQEPAAWKTLRQLHPLLRGVRGMRAAPRHLRALLGAQLVRVPGSGLEHEHGASPRAPVVGAGPSPRAGGASGPWPRAPGSCLAEGSPGAARGAFSQPRRQRLTFACQRVRGVLLASLMLRRPETVQTFIKTLPCGPWDYEY